MAGFEVITEGLTAAEGSVRVSTGVRPLLARLFASFARDGRRLLAPEDVYPVYLELAGQAGVPLSTFPTVPRPSLPAVGVGRGREALLVPEPMVPLGRGLNETETAQIRSWLDEDRERLLVVDCVYTFSERFTKAAETFLAGGQTVLLHSLAKGFLSPDVAGFAIGPAAILEESVHDIRDDSLATAVQILQDASDLPQRLAADFSRRWAALHGTIDLPAPATGYFSVIPIAFNELLARGQLTVPGSVFGSRTGDWSAVTCLLADAPARVATS
jgi:aspartate/methionine/tyrosine aminotransferase